MAMPSHEDDIETVTGHYETVIGAGQEWPNDPPEDRDRRLSWAYLSGYANSRGMTVEELIDRLDIKKE